MSRRRFLELGIKAGGVAAAAPHLAWADAGPAFGGSPTTLDATAFPDWVRQARVADASFSFNPADAELDQLITDLRAQNVSVIETDTELSNWQSDAQFRQLMTDAARFNAKAHAAGMKTVWYYPCLEVISLNGQNGPSFYKTNPTWAQLDINGQPNVFYGGVVFWLNPGDESAWQSPHGPWRDYYLNRVKLLAQTGADAIWPDVPLYYNAVRQWCDTSSWARSAFRSDTGYDIPKAVDWSNPVFRRWVEWRHRALNQWQLDINAAARSVNPNILTIVEAVTMDYRDATLIGLDGAYLRRADGVTQVWEVDVLSNSDAMRYGVEDDWICLIAMFKYARAASGTKPAWSFSYGWRGDDGALVMAEVLATGCNPFEVQVPTKNQSADTVMRTRMYGFAATHSARLFTSASLASVAVYHSSASRDYLQLLDDQGLPIDAQGLFATAIPPAGPTIWWSSGDPQQSCYLQPWLGEYRGTIKALIHARLPFSVVTSPGLSAPDLAPFKVVMLPNLQAVSDAEASVIREYVRAGGAIVITGPNPTGLNQFGDARTNYGLADVLGFGMGPTPPASKVNTFGAGTCYYFSTSVGLRYLNGGVPGNSDYQALVGSALKHVTPLVTTTAPRQVHLEATSLGADINLHFVNFTGLTGTWPSVQPRVTFSASMVIPSAKVVTGVAVCSPDAATPALQPLAYSVANGKVTFNLAVSQYSIVVVTTA